MMGYYDFTDFSPFLERMKKGELTLEEILNNDSIIEDIKTKDQSEFLDFFTNDQMKKLIDYSTRFPKSDDHNTGYKYPFNSTEILCTENIIFYNKLMTEKIIKEKNEKNKKAKDFMKRIHKGGFFEVFFKAIKKPKVMSKNYKNWKLIMIMIMIVLTMIMKMMKIIIGKKVIIIVIII